MGKKLNEIGMKYVRLVLMIMFQVNFLYAQDKAVVPDLSDASKWKLYNREMEMGDGLQLNAKPGDGMLVLQDYTFENVTVELFIKGENNPGQSFVGFAFHIQDESTFEAIYFRPFNFENPDRSGHSVQYISHPEYTWSKLRVDSPGKYENKVSPVPDPDDWFKATIIINSPDVKVFVNDSDVPSLEVTMLSKQRKGGVGFWVGNNSRGSFRDLKITSK